MADATKFHLRRKYLRIFGAEMRMVDEAGDLLAFAEAKRFKLKEDLTLYRDERKTDPLVKIRARQMLDIGATYDVVDALSGQSLGALRRRGMRSIFVRDTWDVLDEHGREIGTIQEDSTLRALLRRVIDLVSVLFPQRYHVTVNGAEVGAFARSFNLFVVKYDGHFDADFLKNTDWRFPLSFPVLLSLIEDSKQ